MTKSFLIIKFVWVTLLAIWFVPTPTIAATITVNSTLGGSLEDLAGNGTCELIEATRAALLDSAIDSCAAGGESDEIDLRSVVGEIDLQAGLSLGGENSSTSIVGPGAHKLRIKGGNLSIDDFGAVTISALTWADGVGSHWATIHVEKSHLTLNAIRLVGNSGGYGGAISIHNSGSLVMRDSEISQSWSQNDGGAIFVLDGATIFITNSTISSNFTRGMGGGISCRRCDLTIENSAITHNRVRPAYPGAGIVIEDFNGEANTVIRNSVIADNFQGEFDGEIVGRADIAGFSNGFGHFGFIEYSIIDESEFLDDTDIVISNSLVQDQVSPQQIGIQPLCFNGGPTRTHMLDPTSIARDFGNPSFTGLAYDQRGPSYRRVVNGRIDAGAVEINPGAIFSDGLEDFTEIEVCGPGDDSQ